MDDRRWTNESVLGLAGNGDPLSTARNIAADLVREADELGVAGPPVDVFALAQARGLRVRASHDLADAQILETTTGLEISFNPNRPRGRLRFSVAHELAHSMFPDVADQVRRRTPAGAVESALGDSDDWELELLCDVIASELLLPLQAVNGILNVDPDIDFFMEVRRRWDVSTEALLRRVATGTPRPLLLAAVSRPRDALDGSLRVDYAVRSSSGDSLLPGIDHGSILHGIEPMLACGAVGQTTRGLVTLGGQELFVQAVGIPPYPGRSWPRILALFELSGGRMDVPNMSFVSGDLLDASGDEPVIFAHIVSDSVRGWSRFGVAGALSKAFPDFATAFRSWTITEPQHLTLGNMHFVDRVIDRRSTAVASLVAQDGFGPASKDRLRYDALATAFQALAAKAVSTGATVHVPRLGAGRAGGRWDRVEELLVANLSSTGVPVVVHTPSAENSGGKA